jgi:uroporphyrinogen-III synthase
MGIHSKGSFALSLKNPKNKGPANTQLPQSPDFPQSIMDDFRGLAWMPVHKSEYLDYPNAQILLIGEGADRFGGGAVDKPEGEKGESPEKELERLEEEDAERVENLDGEDAVFKDLHLRKSEYSELKTTW